MTTLKKFIKKKGYSEVGLLSSTTPLVETFLYQKMTNIYGKEKYMSIKVNTIKVEENGNSINRNITISAMVKKGDLFWSLQVNLISKQELIDNLDKIEKTILNTLKNLNF